MCRFFLLAAVALTSVLHVDAQRRDYLTPAEVEIVRENQDIDLRIDVLSRMVDRRFALLGIEAGGDRPSKNGEIDWGAEPAGTRLELFSDIKQLLEKAIDDIDSIPGRLPEKLKATRKGESQFNKAVRSLAVSAARWLPHLRKANTASANDEILYGVTAASVEFCEQIIEASNKIK